MAKQLRRRYIDAGALLATKKVGRKKLRSLSTPIGQRVPAGAGIGGPLAAPAPPEAAHTPPPDDRESPDRERTLVQEQLDWLRENSIRELLTAP